MANIRMHSALLGLLSQSPSLPNVGLIAELKKWIQQEADDICADVPFHIGDRTKPGAVGDTSVKYPHPAGVATPSSHYLHAPAIGGYQLFDPLTTLVSMKIILRDGQKEWISQQIKRVFRIYNIGAPMLKD